LGRRSDRLDCYPIQDVFEPGAHQFPNHVDSWSDCRILDTKRTALSLQRKDREIVLHGRETGRIIRMPHGEYIEVHEPLDKYEMYKLVEFKSYVPTLARPNSEGKITVKARLRASFSKFYFQDRVAPVGQIELDAAHHDHAPAVEAAPKQAATKTAAAKKPAAKKDSAKKPAAKTTKKAAPKKK
jgi:hypothetical protein